MDSWYLTPELAATLKEYQLDWVSLLKKNRKLEVNSFVLRDENRQPINLKAPHIKVEELVPIKSSLMYRFFRLKLVPPISLQGLPAPTYQKM